MKSVAHAFPTRCTPSRSGTARASCGTCSSQYDRPTSRLSELTYTYTYDQWDHLATAVAVDGEEEPISGRDFSYTFDALGNRTGSGFIANALNQYEYIPGYASPLDYDDRGNLLGDFERSYAYDEQDRLSTVTDSGDYRLTFGYDAQGRMTQRKVERWQGGAWDLTETRAFTYQPRRDFQPSQVRGQRVPQRVKHDPPTLHVLFLDSRRPQILPELFHVRDAARGCGIGVGMGCDWTCADVVGEPRSSRQCGPRAS